MIGVVKPMIILHHQGKLIADIKFEPSVSIKDIDRADLIIYNRNTAPQFASQLDYILRLNKPYIYELDDNFFEIPLETEIGRYHRAPEQLEQLKRYLSNASLVRVYSTNVQDQVKSLNPQIELVTGSVDLDLINIKLGSRVREKIKIVYSTSREKDKLADIFMSDLSRIITEFGDQIEMHFWGYRPIELDKIRNYRHRKFSLDYDRYLRRFSHQGYAIGLAPLLDDRFHRSKTNNKFREYGACKIAGIYSNVQVYTSCVQDGITGLLVNNQCGEWYKALKQLIKNDNLRRNIGEQAHRFVKTHYSIDDAANVWWSQIRSILSKQEEPPPDSPEKTGLGKNSDFQISVEVSGEKESQFSFASFLTLLKLIVIHIKSNSYRSTIELIRRYLASKKLYLKIRISLSKVATFFCLHKKQ